MSSTIVYTGKLVVTSCWCGIRLAIPDDLYDYAQRSTSEVSVWCPVGHKFIYNDRENQRLKRDLKRERDRAAAERARADQAEASRRAFKGVVTRMRRNTLAGECPLCHQHLRDLKRHVQRQHPDEPVELPE